jgi:predicted dehydrogenase
VNWGILGTGGIAHIFAQGLAASRTGRLVAVGSRAQDTALAFGGRYGVDAARCHASYEALLADPTVETVYISLPNHLHAAWTMAAAAAGKHILCEKPLTVNHAEAVRVIEAVRQADVFLMEAFMYRCHPQTARLTELLARRVIGDVRLIECSFSYNMGLKYENIRLSNAAAGGSIMDVGCYPISMARLIAGAEPVVVTGAAHIGHHSRVDEWATACLRFPDGIIANLACGTQVAVDQELRIWGAEGSIRVPIPWKPLAGPNRILVHKNGEAEPTVILVQGGAPLYAIEADTVARHVNSRQAPFPCMTWEDTLGNMAALDAWRQSVGLVFDVERAG